MKDVYRGIQIINGIPNITRYAVCQVNEPSKKQLLILVDLVSSSRNKSITKIEKIHGGVEYITPVNVGDLLLETLLHADRKSTLFEINLFCVNKLNLNEETALLDVLYSSSSKGISEFSEHRSKDLDKFVGKEMYKHLKRIMSKVYFGQSLGKKDFYDNF